MNIGGTVAAVTGASSGVGRCIAERLAAAGAHVGLLGRDATKLEATAAACGSVGVKTRAVAGEISDHDYVASALQTISSELGPIDILVNCAGVSLPARFALEDISPEVWDEMMQTNVRGTYLTCHQLVGGMKARGKGAIVNIGSTAAHVAQPGVSAYAASKFAVKALTDSLLQECEGTGVRVCMVSSGPINTPIWNKRIGALPMDREAMLQPDDIADAVLWLIERPAHVRADEILLRPVGRGWAPQPAAAKANV
ncbi:MAG TPA: SDR family oxidoreductase [Devosiaceae bacterium]|nr:SDR family oxidoreductase [Devosiaceae bacterium]